MLDDLVATLPLLLTGLVLGGMASFTFVFAPLVFMKLPVNVAGGFIRQVFPVHHPALAALSAIAGLRRRAASTPARSAQPFCSRGYG